MEKISNKVYIKEGRITPKYKGYFVSFWKKINGKNTPHNKEEVDELIVKTPDGYIVVSKEYLIKNKILSSDKVKGKLGFRIKEGDDILILQTEEEIRRLYDKDIMMPVKSKTNTLEIIQEEIKLNLYGLEIEYSVQTSYGDIQKLWKKLNNLKKENSIKISYPWRKYGVIYKKDNIYYYFCGFEIPNYNNNIEELINYKVSISEYIEFIHKGNMYNLKNVYKDKFEHLKAKNIKYLMTPLLIEEYTEKFKWNDDESIISILIPIK